MCKITGVCDPGSRGHTLYVPLDRSRHPDVLESTSAICVYDACALPLRSEGEMLQQGEEVMLARNKAMLDSLSRKYGIKGVPILTELKSLSFPLSFPYDFMHLIWENCVDNLILLWTGKFKGLDEGREQYQLNSSTWDAIGTTTAASGSTIPSAFGARPPNFMTQKSACSAETWSFWTLFLRPILLCRRFRKCKYYDHFIDFVKLINMCLQFEISDDEIDVIQVGLIKWVKEYEESVLFFSFHLSRSDCRCSIYYQYNPQQVSACPITIHALLHIADSIKATGPVWTTWAFPIERFCRLLLPAVKSRRFPYASLDRHVIEGAQLLQIKLAHNLQEALDLQPHKCAVQGQLSHSSCRCFAMS